MKNVGNNPRIHFGGGYQNSSEKEDFSYEESPTLLVFSEKRKRNVINKITELLRKFKFNEASRLYNVNRLSLGKFDYYALKDKWLFEYQKKRSEEERRKEREEIERQCELRAPIMEALAAFNFQLADERSIAISTKEYNKLKAKYVLKWFKEHVTLNGDLYFKKDDEEQAAVIIDMSKNTIVAARAGSGKTSTLVAKIVFLVAKYDYKPEDLLVFVFNRDARAEINDRLNKILVDEEPIFQKAEIASTFHSFARKIVYDVCEESGRWKDIIDEDRPYFIQAIIGELPKRRVYNYFRDESFQIKRNKFYNEEAYYEALRTSTYETLRGEIVKSSAEKIICDYLFEHGIKYFYENEIFVKNAEEICKDYERTELRKLNSRFGEASIKPDFYLPDYGVFWEHWAIDGHESFEERSRLNKSGVIGSYDEYSEKMKWKKWFFSKRWIDYDKIPTKKQAMQIKNCKALIETYSRENISREQFEKIIEQKLASVGIYNKKLSDEELIRQVWNRQIKRFSKMVEQFINRTELLYYDNLAALKSKINNFNGDERTKAFLEISFECYQKYKRYLSGEIPKQNFYNKIFRNNREEILDFSRYGIDYSQMVARCIELIKTNDAAINEIKNKRWILIDEYQDFSRLFLDIIVAIRKHCQDSKLFVVGDDWQAINRFAGSDVEYFKKFESYFPEDSHRYEISTNYRCDSKIVKKAGAFIADSLNERSAFNACSQKEGVLEIKNPLDVFIDYINHEDDIYKKNMLIGEKGRAPSKKSVQYLKCCTEIIEGYIENNKLNKEIYILHRNNDTSFWFISLEEFKKRLKKTIVNDKRLISSENFDTKIKVMTMHKSKGLQADVVIILEADEGIIPSYHQDTHLYEIFGETEQIALDDQKRLFYVAMTRAEHALYILHDNIKGNDSFIQYIDGTSHMFDIPF